MRTKKSLKTDQAFIELFICLFCFECFLSLKNKTKVPKTPIVAVTITILSNVKSCFINLPIENPRNIIGSILIKVFIFSILCDSKIIKNPQNGDFLFYIFALYNSYKPRVTKIIPIATDKPSRKLYKVLSLP